MATVDIYDKEQIDSKMESKLDKPAESVTNAFLHNSPTGPVWQVLKGFIEHDLTLDNTEEIIPLEFWDFSTVWMVFGNLNSTFKVGGTIYGDIVSEQKSGYKLDLCVPSMVIYPGNRVEIADVRIVERVEVKRFDGGEGKIAPGDVELTFYYRDASNQLVSMNTGSRTITECTGKRFIYRQYI